MPNIILPDEIKKIIVFRTDRIGEVLLSTVCIDAIKDHFPKSHITFATSNYAKDIIEQRRDVEEIFIFDTLAKSNSFLRLMKLIFYLKKKRFDLALILNPHKILHLGCFLAGVRYRVGYDRKWPFCLTHKIEDKKYEGKKHEIEYNLDLLKIIGIESAVIPPHLMISKDDFEYIQRLIRQSGLDNTKPIICIHPSSSNPKKRWPYKNFALLVKKIKENFSCNIVYVGGIEDKEVVLNIIQDSKQSVLDFSGAFTIKQLAAFLKRCTLFIGNDTGPMHIAAAVGTPVIALFGNASNPTRWRPWGEEHIVLHKDELGAITVAEVTEALKSAPSLRGAIATKQSQK